MHIPLKDELASKKSAPRLWESYTKGEIHLILSSVVVGSSGLFTGIEGIMFDINFSDLFVVGASIDFWVFAVKIVFGL